MIFIEDLKKLITEDNEITKESIFELAKWLEKDQYHKYWHDYRIYWRDCQVCHDIGMKKEKETKNQYEWIESRNELDRAMKEKK